MGGELRLLTGGTGILTAESAEDTEEEWTEEIIVLKRFVSALAALTACIFVEKS
jgi:hypothetical protein